MKRKTSPLSADQIDAILERFVYQDITIQEADEAIQELSLARPLALERIIALFRAAALGSIERETDTDSLLILLSCLGDASTVHSIAGLIGEKSVSDKTKLKLISIVHQLDPQQDMAPLLDHLQNQRLALRASQQDHIQKLQTPSDIAVWLELMETQMEPDMRVAFVLSIAELGDPCSVPVLICMCYDIDDNVAIQAMDAVERLKDARALPSLEELAARHPHAPVRLEARKTADRLGVRAALVPQAPPTVINPLYACYLTTMDGSGGQVALIARQASDERLELVDVMFNDHEGIKQCFGAAIPVDDLSAMLQALEKDGISPVQVTHDQCIDTLTMACDATWASGRPLPTNYVAWRAVIEEGSNKDAARWPTLVVPPQDRSSLLKQCYELLLQDEFAYWFLNPDEIGDLDAEYRNMLTRVEPQTKTAALRALLRKGVRGLITERRRELLVSRLLRVAPLLHDLYEDDEVWQWAVAAADALRDSGSASMDRHPLLLGLVACSLENALDEQIGWIDAL